MREIYKWEETNLVKNYYGFEFCFFVSADHFQDFSILSGTIFFNFSSLTSSCVIFKSRIICHIISNLHHSCSCVRDRSFSRLQTNQPKLETRVETTLVSGITKSKISVYLIFNKFSYFRKKIKPLIIYISLMLSLLGCVLLLHAAYSTYEHHHLLQSTAGIPHDIILELFVGLIALNFGTIKSLKNKPRISAVTSEISMPSHTYLEPIHRSQVESVTNGVGVSEYERLESRVEFMDIRSKRKEHLETRSRS